MVRRGPNIVTGGDRKRHNVRQYKNRLRRQNKRAIEASTNPTGCTTRKLVGLN